MTRFTHEQFAKNYLAEILCRKTPLMQTSRSIGTLSVLGALD
ncbi:MAG: hypothetical protein ACRC62_23865 [Microcoleus sp.]